MAQLIYNHPEPFELELGGRLDNLQIAYHTYGQLNEARVNAIWVCHALTANSDVADWWPHTVVKDGFLDPERYFVVCANILGSCYRTTGPMSVNPATGQPYYGQFPRLTMRDLARAHRLLADRLGLNNIHALIGASVGGFQALEWCSLEPQRFRDMVLIGTAPKASPWNIAINETQRMAIRADGTFGQPRPDAGAAGLGAARALTQQDHADQPCALPGLPEYHRACTYQQHQGRKLIDRFDAYSYMTILDTFDTHDIGRDRGGIGKALQSISDAGVRTCVVGLSTDLVFTPAEMKELAAMIPGSEYHEISSPFGHDGFLVEHGQLNAILRPFLTH